MVVTFCGHRNFMGTKEDEEKIMGILRDTVGKRSALMYLGGYGRFDGFAYDCCRKYKKWNAKVKLIFVTPYLTTSYQKNCLEYQKSRYDEILYPNLENVPAKFSISYRNKYMIDKADVVIAYVNRDWGGAYQTYKYAQRKNKKIYNLAKME